MTSTLCELAVRQASEAAQKKAESIAAAKEVLIEQLLGEVSDFNPTGDDYQSKMLRWFRPADDINGVKINILVRKPRGKGSNALTDFSERLNKLRNTDKFSTVIKEFRDEQSTQVAARKIGILLRYGQAIPLLVREQTRMFNTIMETASQRIRSSSQKGHFSTWLVTPYDPREIPDGFESSNRELFIGPKENTEKWYLTNRIKPIIQRIREHEEMQGITVEFYQTRDANRYTINASWPNKGVPGTPL